jgi:hypothetical protein
MQAQVQPVRLESDRKSGNFPEQPTCFRSCERVDPKFVNTLCCLGTARWSLSSLGSCEVVSSSWTWPLGMGPDDVAILHLQAGRTATRAGSAILRAHSLPACCSRGNNSCSRAVGGSGHHAGVAVLGSFAPCNGIDVHECECCLRIRA